MNKTINKVLLAGDKFMPEIHLRQPQFTYSACGPFTKHKQRIQKFKKTGDTNYIYKNELDKACFVHDAAYSDSKDLTKRTVVDKILKNKAFDIAKDPKYDGYQRGFASRVYKFFHSKVASPDKKCEGSGAKHVNTKLIPQNEQLAEEFHKPVIRKLKKRKVYSAFKDNIWGVDLADMQLSSKYNKGIRFLLCVIDIFSKYAWVVSLKDKKGISIVKAFQSILKQSNRKLELDLSNYATKTDLKNITHVDVSSFASKTNLAALKTEVDKIDTDKLKTTPADLAKLTNAIDHYVVTKLIIILK